MKEDDRLINAVIDLSQEMKGMRKDMNNNQRETNNRLENLEKQQAKTNIAIGELRLSYMNMVEQQEITNEKLEITNKKLDNLSSGFSKYAASNDVRANGHDKRIKKLEHSINK